MLKGQLAESQERLKVKQTGSIVAEHKTEQQIQHTLERKTAHLIKMMEKQQVWLFLIDKE